MELWKLTGAAADALERRPGRPREAEAQAGPGRPREAQAQGSPGRPGRPREARQPQGGPGPGPGPGRRQGQPGATEASPGSPGIDPN